MFVYYECKKCGHAYAASKADPNLGILSLRMNCPTNECDGTMEVADALVDAETVSAQNLYEACMGRGFPNQRLCSPGALKDLLHGGTILHLELSPSDADPNRSLVDYITVATTDSETVHVHLATSTRGATIFKVTPA